jgi:hypothetical protein
MQIKVLLAGLANYDIITTLVRYIRFVIALFRFVYNYGSKSKPKISLLNDFSSQIAGFLNI